MMTPIERDKNKKYGLGSLLEKHVLHTLKSDVYLLEG